MAIIFTMRREATEPVDNEWWAGYFNDDWWMVEIPHHLPGFVGNQLSPSPHWL